MNRKSYLPDYKYRAQGGKLKKVCGGKKRSVENRVKGNKQSTDRITLIKRKLSINCQSAKHSTGTQ